jgi:hypothetical protein
MVGAGIAPCADHTGPVDNTPYDTGQGWAVLVTEKTEANEI